ncbi:cache domain-containing sensor histidine kinase [Paenibacillus naphthalenovorans]|uniref:cache domain-containing sensor histidine kinase n=1 Tax=Paenibacillus naphthalenovorans TaxID=162209 RepID=UPI003D2D7C25
MIRNSIRNKLIVFLLAATIIPFSTSIAMTYFITKHNVIEETIKTNSNLIYQGKTNITNHLNVIQQASLSIYNDTSLYGAVENGAVNYLDRGEIFRGMQAIVMSVKEIQQAYLYLSNSNKSFLFSQGNIFRNEGTGPKYVPQVGKSDTVLEPTHLSHTYKSSGFNPLPSVPVFTLHRSITNAVTMKEFGTLSIDVNLNMIRSIAEQLYEQGKEQLFILDSGGTVIYGPDPMLLGQTLEDGWVKHLQQLDQPSGNFEWNSDEFKGIHIYERMDSPYHDWILVKRIPNELLNSNARQITEINMMILIAFMIVVIGATLVISIRFTTPIKRLIGTIGKIQTGNMHADIDVKGNDEFAILAGRFRSMMERINNLIMREYQLEIANKTNQLKALQAQINPHFLYNSLQSIGTLALQHNAPQVYSLISSLAKLMRYSMNSDTVVPFASELSHVKAYLELQMQRFEHKLTVNYEADESIMHIPVPKMILQPLVENYFKHGFDQRSVSETLTIAARLGDDGRMEIRVQDEGTGMTEDTLQKLRRRLEARPRHQQEEESIGLINVMSRLRLYYEDEAEMIIDHNKPSGVTVTLRIPTLPKEAS